MTFDWPVMLSLLVLVPLIALGYLALERRRRSRLAALGMLGAARGVGRETGSGATGSAVRRPPAAYARLIPVGTVLVGLAVLIVALARPHAVVGIPREEGTVVLAFDVSASMAADDLAPNRMEAAKAAATAFIERQPPTVLIGVVAFSDSGLSIQVPTNDQAVVLAAVDRLAPQRGTSLAAGIRSALDTIAASEGDQNQGYYTNRSPAPTPEPTAVPPGTHTSAVVVLLTDGENTADPDPLDAAQVAADRGIRTHTVGIGSAGGANLEVEGYTVHTQLDEPMLQQIAALTGGAYFRADSSAELSSVYATLDTRLVVREESMEVTSILAGAGLILLLVGGLTSLFWLGRLP